MNKMTITMDYEDYKHLIKSIELARNWLWQLYESNLLDENEKDELHKFMFEYYKII